MKANRYFRMNRDDRAEVGVGTLIVFIAMVLVAAVAAAVLINTAGSLQDRAQRTGQEATDEVSSNLRVMAVYGERNSTADTDLDTVKAHVQLASGAVPMDMSELIVRWSDGVNVQNYNHHATNANPYTFTTTWIRGTSSDDVMRAGDLVEIEFQLGNDLAAGDDVELRFIGETGAPANGDFRAPSTYGDKTTLTLRG